MAISRHWTPWLVLAWGCLTTITAKDACSLAQVGMQVRMISISTDDPDTGTDVETLERLLISDFDLPAISFNRTKSAKDPENVTNISSQSARNITIDRKVVTHGSKRHVVHDRTNFNDTATSDDGEPRNASNESFTKEDEPFAKENVTRIRKVFNVTRKVNATHNESTNVTITKILTSVEIASPTNIASIYVLLFVPIAIAWVLYLQQGRQIDHYKALLPITLCLASIGLDLVNQSLTIVLESPNAITAFQAGALGISTLLWTLFVDLPQIYEAGFEWLPHWSSVAFLFAVYQILAHVLYALSSLSERTVVTNLCPVVALLLETLFMPLALKPDVSFGGKLALSVMVVGATVFSSQSPTFSARGLAVAISILVKSVPLRLLQRHFLSEATAPISACRLPLAVLASVDGFMLLFPSFAISVTRNMEFWVGYETWTDPPVMLMLILSMVTFVFSHMCSLALLRLGPATNFLVFQNIASIATVACGILFFGDQAFASPLACFGLAANIGSGIWYSSVTLVPPSDSELPFSDAEKSLEK